MSKKFYIILPIISLAVMAAIFFHRPQPVPYRVGVVDIKTLFTTNSEFMALDRLMDRRGALGASLLADKEDSLHSSLSSEIMANEWDMFFEAAAVRNEALTSARKEKMLASMDRAMDSITNQFSEKRDKLFRESESSLDKAYMDISNELPLPSLLFEEKFSLFNQKLKLEVLTRDSFVMPDVRLKTINKQIEQLESVIDEAEKKYMTQIQTRFQQESEEIRAQLEDTQTELEQELELSMDIILNINREKLSSLVMQDQEETAEMVLASSNARRSMTGEFIDALDRQLAPAEEKGASLETAEKNLQAEFIRRASRKAPAIAEKNSVSIIFNTGFAVAGDAVNLTGKF